MDWLSAIGALTRLTSGSIAGIPLPFVLVAPVIVVLLLTRLCDGAATTPAKTLKVRRPGWIAQRRAKAGIKHPPDRMGLGYASMFGLMHISLVELAGNGLFVGHRRAARPMRCNC